MKNKQDPWITVTSINPRGKVYGMSDHDPLQQNISGLANIGPLPEGDLVGDLSVDADDRVFEETDEEIDEFGENQEQSDYSSDSSE